MEKANTALSRICWLALSASMLTATATAQTPGSLAPVEVAPPPLSAGDVQWASLPTGQDIARVYPPVAERRNVSGGAVITCRISGERTLEACRVLGKKPAWLGFGEAALKMTTRFKLKAEQRDPRAVAGAEVVIPVGFRIWN
jgi:TonB family protein